MPIENVEVGGLPSASALDGSELTHVVQGGTSKQATIGDVARAAPDYKSQAITDGSDIVFAVDTDEIAVGIANGFNGTDAAMVVSVDGGSTYLGTAAYVLMYMTPTSSGAAADASILLIQGAAYTHRSTMLRITGCKVAGPAAYSGLRCAPTALHQSGWIMKSAAITHVKITFSGTIPSTGTAYLHGR